MIDIPAIYIQAVDPGTYQRARRLYLACDLLSKGLSQREVRSLIQDRFDCSLMTAWRVVDKALSINHESARKAIIAG